MASTLAADRFWVDKANCHNAERQYYELLSKQMDGITTLTATPASGEVLDRVAVIEKDNADLRNLIESLRSVCLETQSRITALEKKVNTELAGKTSAPAPASNAAPAKAEADDDDDVDLFGSEDEEDEEAARVREERLAAYAAKKSKKPQIIAKSSLILDVKPWDDETDLKVMETEIRKIVSDGLLWGASKFVPVAFGIQKLSISCVVEDDKVSIDWLTEEIEKLEDYVQSVDVAAFNKI
ncbi:probable elongation factor 1-delta isoform X2 [Zeugodacus cucurbitae]|uniref:probable elongation factor 1-delta isoform X2 n=1 Tax=Zeugodacus cucurbitae TaxID=28588 RepID=UPI0023D8E29D|nr:probable elongation factor 1-delta isoform X2 [Zeugodacus cucurbitae]